jgi:hypothetical protein
MANFTEQHCPTLTPTTSLLQSLCEHLKIIQSQGTHSITASLSNTGDPNSGSCQQRKWWVLGWGLRRQHSLPKRPTFPPTTSLLQSLHSHQQWPTVHWELWYIPVNSNKTAPPPCQQHHLKLHHIDTAITGCCQHKRGWCGGEASDADCQHSRTTTLTPTTSLLQSLSGHQSVIHSRGTTMSP